MARVKSAFRKRTNIRWLRHILTRAIVRLAPALARPFNIPPRGVAAISLASRVFEDRSETVELPVNSRHKEQVLLPAISFDTGDASGNAAARSHLRSQIAILEGCVAAGHTRMILREADRAIVHFDERPANPNYGKAKILKRKQAGPGLHVIVGWAPHYYHFFANEILPLLYFLERYAADSGPITLAIPETLTPYQRDVIDALRLNYPGISLSVLHSNELLCGAPLLWNFRLVDNHEWAPVDRDCATRLVEMLARPAHSLAAQGTGARIFISRRDARTRSLRDESEIEAMLRAEGFETFVPGKASLAEQIAVMRGAEIIVSVHGAALTNLQFCRAGKRVIEIFPSNFVKSTFLWLALRLDLEYFPVTGGPGDFDQHFIGGVETVRRAVHEAIGPRTETTSA